MRHPYTSTLIRFYLSSIKHKADILIPLDKYPTGEKRFNLQINGSHDTSTPWLSHHVIWTWMKMGRWETRRIGHPNKSTRTISR